MLGWDSQLEDDARLVTTVARTAAWYGAHVRTRARVVSATGTSVELRDELTGANHSVTARTVINATGVWAGDLVDEIQLRPSRGTHLVLREETLPGLRVVVYAPIPGTFNRFVLVLPQPDGTVYVGLTDEPADGPVPDVPQPTEPRSASSSTWCRPPSSAPSTAPTWWVRSPGSGRCSTSPARARPPTSRGGTPSSPAAPAS